MTTRVEPSYAWTGKHLYQVWPSGRRVYMGSILRESFKGAWSAWQKGAYVGSFSDQEGAREALVEFAKEQEKPQPTVKS